MTTTLTRKAPAEKVLTAKVKAEPVLDANGGDQGIVEAYVSIFGNKDSYGDVMMPGSFAESIAAFDAGAKQIPVVWSHQSSNPEAYIGDVTALVEDERGLKVTMQFDLEDPFAAKAYKNVKGGRVSEWSFGFKYTEIKPVETETEFYYEVTGVDLYEVGPCLMGANSETHTISAKSADTKAGRTISTATAKALKSARDGLQAALDEIETLLALTDDGKSIHPAESVVTGAKATEAGDAGKAPDATVFTADEATRWADALT